MCNQFERKFSTTPNDVMANNRDLTDLESELVVGGVKWWGAQANAARTAVVGRQGNCSLGRHIWEHFRQGTWAGQPYTWAVCVACGEMKNTMNQAPFDAGS